MLTLGVFTRAGIFVLVGMILFSFPRCSRTGNEFPVVREAPDFELINQDQEKVRLSQFQESVKFISFIYIRCSMARMCPLTTKNFRRLQKLFREDQAKRVELMLITFDPQFDTPGALKKYGEMYEADFSNWNFLTGSEEEIDAVCENYEIIHEKQENGMIRHSIMAYLIDKQNNIRKIYIGNDWDPLRVKLDILSLLK
jgi:protein SCO1/2